MKQPTLNRYPTGQMPYIEGFLPKQMSHFGRATHSVTFYVEGVPRTSKKAVSRALAIAAVAGWLWEWSREHSTATGRETANGNGGAASSSSGSRAVPGASVVVTAQGAKRQKK